MGYRLETAVMAFMSLGIGRRSEGHTPKATENNVRHDWSQGVPQELLPEGFTPYPANHALERYPRPQVIYSIDHTNDKKRHAPNRLSARELDGR